MSRAQEITWSLPHKQVTNSELSAHPGGLAVTFWGHQPQWGCATEPQQCRAAPGDSLQGSLENQFALSQVLWFNLPSLSPLQEQKAQRLPSLQVRSNVSTRCDRGRPVANS